MKIPFIPLHKLFNTMWVVFSLSLVIFLLFSCEKDAEIVYLEKTSPEDHDCTEVSHYGAEQAIVFSYESIPRYKYPCFNPTNADEFAYISAEENSKYELHIYNLSTNSDKKIADINPVSSMQWCKNGWIVLVIGREIWKITESGGQLTQLTSTKVQKSNLHLDYQNNIVYTHNYNYSDYVENPSLEYRHKMFKCDINGNTLDSFCIVNDGYCMSWEKLATNSDNNWCYIQGNIDSNNFGIYESNDLSSAPNLTLKLNEYASIQGLTWHPNNTDIFYIMQGSGIYKVNTLDKQNLVIKNECFNRTYNSLSISSDGKKIISVRTKKKWEKSTKGEWYDCNYYYYIETINIENGTQKIILSPNRINFY